MFGTIAGIDPEVLSATTLTVTTPTNLPSGQVVVVVTNPDNQSSSHAIAARTGTNSARRECLHLSAAGGGNAAVGAGDYGAGR